MKTLRLIFICTLLISTSAEAASCLHLENGKAYKCEEPIKLNKKSRKMLKNSCASGNQKAHSTIVLEGRMQDHKCKTAKAIARCEVPKLNWYSYYYPSDLTIEELKKGCMFFKGAKFTLRRSKKK